MSYNRMPINLNKGAPRIALVGDALPLMGGAERTLQAAMQIYPAAPIYTLMYNRNLFAGTDFERRPVYTSFINRLPAASKHYRSYLPLFPLAIEQFDLSAFDVLLSFSYAVAHGVLSQPDQLHLSYTFTPMRQAWQRYHIFLSESGLKAGLRGWAAKALLHYMRQWDFAAAARVDRFVAVSQWVAKVISRVYRREAEVLYPPVDVERFQPLAPRQDFFVMVARLVPHKRVDLAVDAFARLGLPLVVVGDGSERRRIAARLAANVQLLGWQPDSMVQDLLSKARAFVMPAEEDFGIAAVEAQAAGCPVIAYSRGGALETVVAGETGRYFDEQSAECLAETVQSFVREAPFYDPLACRRNAERFSKERFQAGLKDLVEREWQQFKSSSAGPSFQ